MQLQVNRASFLKALQLASKAAPSMTTKDILKNIRLTSKTNQIVLMGTNTEIGLRVEVSDVVRCDGGECLLPTSRVIQILGEMTNDSELKIDVGTGDLWIRGHSSEFRLLTEDPEDFPPVPEFGEESFFKLKAADLRRLIKRTIFACDNESTRYALGGIQVEFTQEGRVIFAATDSKRLAVDNAPCEMVGKVDVPSTPPVVPQKAMKLLLSLLEDEGEALIAFNKNGLAAKVGLSTLSTQFVQGRFPDWRRVMPTSAKITVDFICSPFFGAIRQAMIMRSEESRAIDFSFTKDRLRLRGDVADMGSSKVDIPIAYQGPEMILSFDPTFFADYLKTLDGAQQIQFKLLSKDDPGLLEIDDYRMIIMPLSKDR